jgi:hypothetical protein
MDAENHTVQGGTSGGVAFDFKNNVTALLPECLADTQAYYENSFDPPAANHRDEYHHLEIKVAKPGVSGRTREGYYAEPGLTVGSY